VCVPPHSRVGSGSLSLAPGPARLFPSRNKHQEGTRTPSTRVRQTATAPAASPPEYDKKKMRATVLPTRGAAATRRAARPTASVSVRAAAGGPRDQVKAGASPPTKTAFPELETSDRDGGLLPRREPGSFPSPALVAAWQRLSVELLEGADTGAPPAATGQEAAYDPLRDGPARYLGYSNECGCVFLSFFVLSAAHSASVGRPGVFFARGAADGSAFICSGPAPGLVRGWPWSDPRRSLGQVLLRPARLAGGPISACWERGGAGPIPTQAHARVRGRRRWGSCRAMSGWQRAPWHPRLSAAPWHPCDHGLPHH
jgi:hypothetical protein